MTNAGKSVTSKNNTVFFIIVSVKLVCELVPFRFRNLGKNNVKNNHSALYFSALAEFNWGRGKFDDASL
jgi:hypothetical protein